MATHSVIILGSGPAGLTAAIYAARANLEPFLIRGEQPGGQLTITTDVENYPGFKDGIMGPDLMVEMEEQAKRFGTKILEGQVTRVDLSRRPYRVWIEDRVEEGLTVIIATGATAMLLGLESENALMGHGVSACATCDGFFFRDQEVAIVGGGDTAMEEATFLTRFASKVTVLHRRDELRASKIMRERARSNPKIKWLLNTVVTDVFDPKENKVTGIRIKNVKTDEESTLAVNGLFIAIGHKPNTDLFKGQLDMNDRGYLLVEPGTAKTKLTGVFASGDVSDPTYRQAVTAAMDAERLLEAEAHSAAGATVTTPASTE